MSIVFFIFIFILYIIIILFSRLQYKANKSSTLKKKEDDYLNSYSFIPNKAKILKNENNYNRISNYREKKDETVIDNEVKDYYNQDEVKDLPEKSQVIDREKTISNQGDNLELREHLTDDILVDGIILSEIIALPRALKHYKFKKYNRKAE